MATMSGEYVILASTTSDAATKFINMFGAVAGFLAILLIIFFAAGRATGRFARPLAITVFLGPALLLLIVGLIYPAVRTVYLSFMNEDGDKYLGWKNYKWAFTTDYITHEVLLNTLLWILIVPVVTTALGLLVALLVDRLKREAVYKSLIFAPMAVSFVGASFIWRFVYETRDPANPQIGLLSQVVMALGWKHPPNWILSSPLNNFLLMVIMIWVQTGFAMVVLSAAIKAIPTEIVEAARMDGAKGARLFALVTVPMIRNTLIVVLSTITITTLKVFDIIRTMTGGNFGTQVLSNEMYSQSFEQYNTGRGATLATILFIAVLPLVGYNIVQLRRERGTR
jgi:alpha-glucoside transport system permease protein